MSHEIDPEPDRLELDDRTGEVRLYLAGRFARQWDHPDDVCPSGVPWSLHDELDAIRDEARDWFDPGEEARHAYDTSRGTFRP